LAGSWSGSGWSKSTVDLPVDWKVKREVSMRIGELADQAGISTKAIRP